uniref:Prefoldin subunit 2 n=1 Tax=Phasianus colchicus TaxID=9054 RepID=A0A669QAT8_PHACC
MTPPERPPARTCRAGSTEAGGGDRGNGQSPRHRCPQPRWRPALPHHTAPLPGLTFIKMAPRLFPVYTGRAQSWRRSATEESLPSFRCAPEEAQSGGGEDGGQREGAARGGGAGREGADGGAGAGRGLGMDEGGLRDPVMTPRGCPCSLVIETLREVDPTRKCYRMVGGILVERTVKEVLPALEGNREQISKIIETLTQQLQSKGRELNEFREKHNIRLVGEDDPRQPPKDGTEGGKGSAAGVLVS